MNAQKTFRILYIEDEPSSVEIAVATLRNSGLPMSMDARYDLQSGIEALLSDRFDVCLLDLKLPGHMDGVDVVSKVHAAVPDMMIDVLSGALDKPGARDECKKQGAYRCFSKTPWPVNIFETVYADLVEQERLLPFAVSISEAFDQILAMSKSPFAGVVYVFRHYSSRLKERWERRHAH